MVSEAPKTKSAVKVPIAASMALIFGTETGFVEVKMFNEMKADAGPAYGLKGFGDYRSLYVNNNDHANHRPKDAEHRTVEFMCSGDWGVAWRSQEERWTTRPSASGHSSYQGRNSRIPMQDVRGMPASAGSRRRECGLHKVHLAKGVCQELGLWHCDKAYARRPDLQPCL